MLQQQRRSKKAKPAETTGKTLRPNKNTNFRSIFAVYPEMIFRFAAAECNKSNFIRSRVVICAKCTGRNS